MCACLLLPAASSPVVTLHQPSPCYWEKLVDVAADAEEERPGLPAAS